MIDLEQPPRRRRAFDDEVRLHLHQCVHPNDQAMSAALDTNRDMHRLEYLEEDFPVELSDVFFESA